MTRADIHKKLSSWFREHRRHLPWRETDNWYHIWVSEVMLQQTQVEQVMPYYLRFIKNFRTVRKLAAASRENVLKSWEGLGYYSRARHLHESAKIIVNEYNGHLPADKTILQKLPGFGPYTTNAVLSLAFNKPYAVVDGNVKRVISRLFLINDDMRKTAAHKKVQTVMDQLLPAGESRLFNEAVMELGALICLPSNPHCGNCPLVSECLARKKGLQDELPYLSKKARIPLIHAVSFIIKNDTNYLLVKRPSGGMLAELWEFPAVKMPGSSMGKIPAEKQLFSRFGLNDRIIKMWPVISHSYTHFHLKLKPVLLLTEKKQIKLNGYSASRWLPLAAIKKFPLHRAMWKLLDMTEKDLITIPD